MRFSWLGGGTPPLIGVDISSSAVKMLELAESGKDTYRVERYAIAQLPKDALSDGNIAKPEAVEQAMQQAWKAMGTRTRNIAMALPSSAVISKKIHVPAKASETELEDHVSMDASQMTSSPADEIAWDYQVLGPSSTKQAEENEALVVVAKRDRVEERVAIAEAVGLKTVVMDVDDMAALTAYSQVSNQLPHGGKGLTVAMVDIGANFTHVNVLHGNRAVFRHSLSYGGYILTKDIARHFNISLEEAEDSKRKGQLPPTYQSDVLPIFLDGMSQQINTVLKNFTTSTAYHSVDHVLLAGGCALLPGIVETLHNRTQVPVTVANPFARMGVSAQVRAPRLAADAPLLYVACGLALRRFDPT